MKEIEQKLEQWVYNSLIRAEIWRLIEDQILDEKVNAFKAGWMKGAFGKDGPFDGVDITKNK